MLGGNTSNQVFPFFLEENPLYYDSNASTQLQLFGGVSAVCNTDQVNIKINDNNNEASALNPPMRRHLESEDFTRRNNLQISLNNLFRDETDRSLSIPNTNTVSTGLRLSYDDEERHSSVTTASGSMSSLALTTSFLDSFGPEIEHQNEEFNCYLRMQEEQLLRGVREMNQRHVASFMNMIDRELSRKLRDKDLEMELMARKNRELADQIRQAAAEAHTWQQRAQYNESVVHALRSSLQHMMAQGTAAATAANHAREGCGESEVDDAASSMYPNSVPDGGKRVLSMACKGCCRGKKSCMLLLPCRHLCLCRDCEAMVDACPVCFIRKTASVEVYMP
ncbi:hypothetical protein KSP39_PZI017202 [Platanthera zijinensis]|uniref:RING-type domain-containing protein n=1 Tax=Platanthera zijinensis TaxID=2320716 RepID=A0AAP0FZK7_9ASPA